MQDLHLKVIELCNEFITQHNTIDTTSSQTLEQYTRFLKKLTNIAGAQYLISANRRIGNQVKFEITNEELGQFTLDVWGRIHPSPPEALEQVKNFNQKNSE